MPYEKRSEEIRCVFLYKTRKYRIDVYQIGV